MSWTCEKTWDSDDCEHYNHIAGNTFGSTIRECNITDLLCTKENCPYYRKFG